MPRLIEFQGRQIELPDGATDADVAAALSQPSAAALSGVPTPAGATRFSVTPTDPPSVVDAPRSGNDNAGFGPSLKVGAQGVGRGMASLAGSPVDLMTGAINLGIGTKNLFTENQTPPITQPFGGSGMIRDAASSFGDLIGAPPTPESQMTPGQKLGYNISNYGTQFAVPAAGLAASARGAASAVAPTVAGRLFDTLRQPYQAAPARTAIGDVAGGVGAGSAVNALDDNLSHDSPWKPLAEIGAVLAGGVGGAGAVGAAEGIGGMLRSMWNNRVSDTNVPKSPTTGAPFTQAETERAARSMQVAASNPTTAAQNIRENAGSLTNPALPGEVPLSTGELPTSGNLSRDIGLVTAETGARTRNNAPFIERDQNVKAAAAGQVDSLRDPNADLTAPRAVAQQEADTRIGEARTAADTRTNEARGLADTQVNEARTAAERAVQQAQADVQAGIAGAQTRLTAAEQSLREAEATMQQQGAPIAARGNADAKAQASTRLDNAVVNEGYIPARTEKNRQFDEAPGRHDQLPADDVIAAARAVQRGINDLAPGTLPHDFVQRLRALEPRIVEGENVGGTGTAPGGDLADMRKFLSSAYETAQRAGNYDLADNIATLRRAVNRTIEDAPGYAEANANYQQFAGTYRPSPNDEAAKFTRQIDRDPQRGNTPPSETAGRFLAGPEKTQALQRMLENSPQGAGAVREYLLSDFGMSAMNPNGTVNANRAAAWGRNNADVLAQFPQLRQEFDGFVATARRGDQLSTEATQNIDAARRNLAETERQGARTVNDTATWANRRVADTERETGKIVSQIERAGQDRVRGVEQDVNNSAAGTLLREDPRDVAQRLLGTKKYGSSTEIDEINKLVGSDPAAKAGWKAAVSEVLVDRVTGTKKVGETHEVQAARLAKEFKDNEQVLAKVFDPEEMNTLRQAHTLLGYFKEAEKRATVGSNTADKMQIPGWLQLATRHIYGDLKGGGVIKRFKLLMDVLPSNRNAAEEVVNMAWFNPDVAAYLLERPVRNLDAAPRNVPLGRWQALVAGGRESAEPQN